MAARYFVTRSAIDPPRNDCDARMQSEQIGPFDNPEEARVVWAERLTRALLHTYSGMSWEADFRGQYLALLTAANDNAEWDKVEGDGIRWTLRKIG